MADFTPSTEQHAILAHQPDQDARALVAVLRTVAIVHRQAGIVTCM